MQNSVEVKRIKYKHEKKYINVFQNTPCGTGLLGLKVNRLTIKLKMKFNNKVKVKLKLKYK